MSYDFPSNPTEDQEFVPPVGGQTYVYKAPRWLVKGVPPTGAEGGGGGIPEAPINGNQYARQNAAWTTITIPSNDWNSITGKPVTFPPTVPIAWTDVNGKPATYPPTLPIDWADVSGKPATYPPTLPIAQSGVTGLATALAGKVDDTGDTMTGDLTISKGLPLLSIIGAAVDDWASVWFQPDVATSMSGWDIGADNNGFWIDRYSPGVTSPIHIDTTDSMALINQMWITSDTPNILLNGTSGAAKSSRVRLFNNFKGRWDIGTLGDAETGSDAGSTFTIMSYHDDGSYSNTPLQINRAANRVQVAGDPTAPLQVATKQYADTKVADTGDTMTGALSISMANPSLTLTKAASGQVSYIQGWLGGAARWRNELGDAAAESTGNVGSNYRIVRYDDAGAAIDAPVNINRATGLATVIGDPTAALGVATKQYVDNKPSGGATVSDTAPSTPTQGMLWFDSTTASLFIYYNDGDSSQWIQIGGTSG